MTKSIRARTTMLLASVAIGVGVVILTPMLGAWPQSTAQAQYIVAAEFRDALSPYGRWQHHSRWGEVWIADPVPADWRPYTRGRWLYTEEWGWYWETADEEANWGWVTNHYGRWVHDGDLGWLWVPGEDWGPAWVDWRRGTDYVGWAPLPPDDVIVEYRDDPIYWSFVQPRYLLAPRIFAFVVPPRDRIVIIRKTVIVNRTVIVSRVAGNESGGDPPGRSVRWQARPLHGQGNQHPHQAERQGRPAEGARSKRKGPARRPAAEGGAERQRQRAW
jgi:hypothetical protein